MAKDTVLFLLIPILNIASTACMDLEFLTSIDFPSTEELHQNPLAAILRTVVGNIYQTLKGTNDKANAISHIVKNLDKVIHNIKEEDLKVVVEVIDKEIDLYGRESKNNSSTELLKEYVREKIREMAKNGDLKLKLTDLLEKKKSNITNAEFFGLLSELFSMEDLANINTYLKSFNVYSQNKNRAMQEKTVKDAIDFSLIQVYEKMDDKSKRKLNEVIVDTFVKGKSGIREFELTLEADEDGFRKNLKNNETDENLILFANGDDDSSLSVETTTDVKHKSSCAMSTGITGNENQIEMDADNFNRVRENVGNTKDDIDTTTDIDTPTTETNIFY